jgi:hypothetical protein
MDKLPGEALLQRLSREARFAQLRTRLPQEMGRVLARIHQMNAQAMPGLSGGDQLEQLRWAVMCRFQANRALVHGEGNALELLAIGHKVAECEHDLLVMIGLGRDTAAANPTLVGQADPDDLFGRPSAAELLAAVQTFVRERCSDDDPQSKYLGRVACSVLDVAAREINLGGQRRAAHRDALAAIGFATEAELALALRTGKCSVSDPAVAQSVRQAVAARLAVANPGYLNRRKCWWWPVWFPSPSRPPRV